jgi:hypothetical protein
MRDRSTRAVIGGVGYRNLRDHSLGIVLSDELEVQARPPTLLVEDLSYNPVAVGQWLADESGASPITRALFVSAVAREDGRPPGTISAYRWDRVLPDDETIQRAVTDAVTGIILVDNTLIVTEWMRALPPEVIVVEVEALEHAFGDEMSAPVAAAYDVVRRLVLRLATDDAAATALVVAPLGGEWSDTASGREVG